MIDQQIRYMGPYPMEQAVDKWAPGSYIGDMYYDSNTLTFYVWDYQWIKCSENAYGEISLKPDLEEIDKCISITPTKEIDSIYLSNLCEEIIIDRNVEHNALDKWAVETMDPVQAIDFEMEFNAALEEIKKAFDEAYKALSMLPMRLIRIPNTSNEYEGVPDVPIIDVQSYKKEFKGKTTTTDFITPEHKSTYVSLDR